VTDGKFYHLECIKCGSKFDERKTATSCLKCGDSLDAIYDYDFIRQRLNTYSIKNAPISALKYLDFYPIIDLENVVSLKEGGTPLYHAENLGKKLGLKNIYIKDEGANPTGCFKDRGSLVEITKALEVGSKAICLASSGNMAASCAAYSAVAKIPCYVLVPEGTPIGKLAQTISYGARILQVRAPYSRCAELAVETAKKHNFYLAGDYVFRSEGQKSQAYEIIEQLDWNVPDYVIVPVGCGTNLSAIWKGFLDYKEVGLIKKLPKMIGVQPTGCATVYEAFDNNKKSVKRWDAIDTVCSAVAVNYPLDGNKVLKGIYKSKGRMTQVTDEETLNSEQLLARSESIFVEPSGALGIAALCQLAKNKIIKKDDTVVVVATGNGLKDPVTALKYQPAPATLEPDLDDISSYLNNKLYNLKATQISMREKELWGGQTPDINELAKYIEKEFGITITGKCLEGVHKNVARFITRGKAISEQDLQAIIEINLQEFSSKEAVLRVKDFELSVYRKKRAHAKLEIDFHGKRISVEGEGVGPVDALINGIRKGIESKDKLNFELLDYVVKIHTGGTDAAVEVRIKVNDKSGNEVVGAATSPDIIQASVDAFVRAYNALYWKNS